MKFKLITCINHLYVLGINNHLLFHIKNDLSNFKRITINNVVIMGRKTLESLPFKPLPNRVNIIITSNKDFKCEGCEIVHSIEDCIKLCEEKYSHLDCYVIGGGKIYEEFINNDLIETMYITEVDDFSDGDTYFPNVFLDDKWNIFYQSGSQFDKESGKKYFFNILKRVKE